MAVRKDHTNQSKWHRMTPEQKARRLETMRAWQRANPDRISKYYQNAKQRKGTGNRSSGYGQYEKARKYNFVRDQKIAIGQCVDCQFPCDEVTHVCFAWDHPDPTTKHFSLSKAHKYTWEEIQNEIAKCELVCHNCHAIRTYLEGHNRSTPRATDDTQPTLFD